MEDVTIDTVRADLLKARAFHEASARHLYVLARSKAADLSAGAPSPYVGPLTKYKGRTLHEHELAARDCRRALAALATKEGK